MVATSCQLIREEKVGTEVSPSDDTLQLIQAADARQPPQREEEEKDGREEIEQDADRKLQKEEMIHPDDCGGATGVDDITLIVL